MAKFCLFNSFGPGNHVYRPGIPSLCIMLLAKPKVFPTPCPDQGSNTQINERAAFGRKKSSRRYHTEFVLILTLFVL